MRSKNSDKYMILQVLLSSVTSVGCKGLIFTCQNCAIHPTDNYHLDIKINLFLTLPPEVVKAYVPKPYSPEIPSRAPPAEKSLEALSRWAVGTVCWAQSVLTKFAIGQDDLSPDMRAILLHLDLVVTAGALCLII